MACSMPTCQAFHASNRAVRAVRDLVKTVDLTKPHQWYPMARALQRRIIYHAGPTNSGKTYAALQVTSFVLDTQIVQRMRDIAAE